MYLEILPFDFLLIVSYILATITWIAAGRQVHEDQVVTVEMTQVEPMTR